MHESDFQYYPTNAILILCGFQPLSPSPVFSFIYSSDYVLDSFGSRMVYLWKSVLKANVWIICIPRHICKTYAFFHCAFRFSVCLHMNSQKKFHQTDNGNAIEILDYRKLKTHAINNANALRTRRKERMKRRTCAKYMHMRSAESMCT